MVEDKIQDLNSMTCGIFQIYFYDNLFNPDENSKTEDKNQLNKRTIKLYRMNVLFLPTKKQKKRQLNNTLTKRKLMYKQVKNCDIDMTKFISSRANNIPVY